MMKGFAEASFFFLSILACFERCWEVVAFIPVPEVGRCIVPVAIQKSQFQSIATISRRINIESVRPRVVQVLVLGVAINGNEPSSGGGDLVDATNIQPLINDEDSQNGKDVAEQDGQEIKTPGKNSGLALVPLFFKFCVVLAVKFITDVLVFPPLFIWRFGRLIFSKLRKLFFPNKRSEQGKSSP